MTRKNQPGCPCCGAPPDDTVGVPTCSCPFVPIVLTITNVSGGPTYDETVGDYTHGTSPAVLALGPPSYDWWLNPTIHHDDFSDEDYYWTVACHEGFFSLGNYFPASNQWSTGGLGVYGWSAGNPGNSCVPFHMPNGFDAIAAPHTFLLLEG